MDIVMNTAVDFNENTTPQYHLEVFDGPLDLLLRLIAKNKVDILDIPIALILDQYLEYVGELEKTDADIAGDFIAMAAELMLIKSKMLLPREGDKNAIDPRAELVRSLMDYKQAKEKAAKLNSLFALYSGRMAKESEEIDVDITYVAPQELDYLFKAFERIERRKKLMALSRAEESEQNLRTIATKKPTPVHEKVFNLLRYMKRRGGSALFEELIERNETKSDRIATFIAILQLVRKGELKIVADDPENPKLEINYERDKLTTIS